jgi:hypothetical protein
MLTYKESQQQSQWSNHAIDGSQEGDEGASEHVFTPLQANKKSVNNVTLSQQETRDILLGKKLANRIYK